MIKKHSRNKHYWFTIVAANGEPLATSETYTTAAMRDKGIEAVKQVVWNVCWQSVAKQVPKRKPSDTFHLENKKGKIVKR